MRLMLGILNIFCGLDILVEVCLIVIPFTNSFMKIIQMAITELLPYVKSSKTTQQCCL